MVSVEQYKVSMSEALVNKLTLLCDHDEHAETSARNGVSDLLTQASDHRSLIAVPGTTVPAHIPEYISRPRSSQ